MQIKKDTWHYRAYAFTYNEKHNKMPETTSLCQYVNRIIFVLPLMVFVLTMLLTVITAGLIVVNILTVGLGFGLWLINFDSEVPGLFKYKDFGSVKVRGREIPCYYIGSALCATFAIGVGLWRIVAVGKFTLLLQAGGAILLLCLVGWLIVRATSKTWNSDTAQLARAYAKARKDNICPIVSFEE